MHDQPADPKEASLEGSQSHPLSKNEESADDAELHLSSTNPRVRLSAIQLAATHAGDEI
jgi:hypothetical protein